MKRGLAVAVLLLFSCILLPSGVFAQDGYDPISAEKLREVLEDVRSWAAETLEFIKNTPSLTPRQIVEQADGIRKKFDPVMVLMATTEPEPEYKQAAVMLLMGAKGVELSLWHYIYAVIGDSQQSKDHGDVVLTTAVRQLNIAYTLFSALP